MATVKCLKAFESSTGDNEETIRMNATSGREIFFFFPDCHLAPNFFKVVVNSKIVCRHFQKQTKHFFTLSAFLIDPSKIMLRKRSFTCHKVDTRMDDIQRSSPPKSKMAFSYRSKGTCCVLETNLTRKFTADLSLQIC